MIFLLSNKTWNKYKNKLVRPHDYIVVDATDDADSKLIDLTNVVTVDDLAVPPKLLKMFDEDDLEDILDPDSLKELQDNFFKSHKFKSAVLAAAKTFVDNNVNVFIIIRKKAYENWRKIYEKEILHYIPELSNCFYIMSTEFTKDEKKLLSKELSSDKLNRLDNAISEREQALAKESDKIKKKKKKHKKHKKSGFGFDDWDL